MTDRAAIEKLVRDTWIARRADRCEDTMSNFHADSSLRFVCSPDFAPMSETARGKAVREMMARLIADWDLSELSIASIGIDGDTAYVRHKGTARHKGKGNTMNADVLDVIRVADGKIIEYTQFTDTYLVAKTAGMIRDRRSLKDLGCQIFLFSAACRVQGN